MKSRNICIFIFLLLAICIGLSLFLMIPREPKPAANIISCGKTVQTVSLTENASFDIETINGGYNRVVVRDGKISVTEANCPDHVCMSFGWCSDGIPIVCLPNQLIIEFPGGDITDSVSG